VQSARDASNAIGDLRMGPPALAADDAKERMGLFGHCLLPIFAGLTSFPGDAKHRAWNLEIPGLALRAIPE
jgi:hypothetical protein